MDNWRSRARCQGNSWGDPVTVVVFVSSMVASFDGYPKKANGQTDKLPEDHPQTGRKTYIDLLKWLEEVKTSPPMVI